jgi:hypothetical protein
MMIIQSLLNGSITSVIIHNNCEINGRVWIGIPIISKTLTMSGEIEQKLVI